MENSNLDPEYVKRLLELYKDTELATEDGTE